MSDARERLEILISRYLDEEATRDDRRELMSTLRRDSAADALFEEHRAIDREVRRALRQAMGRSIEARVRLSWSARALRYGAMAAAAAIALFVWDAPRTGGSRPGAPGGSPQMASWFAPPPSWGDSLAELPASYERPQVRVNDTDRDWIVIPGERAGEFLVVEVKRIQTRAIPLHEDF